jgi:hypothetical protein
MLHVLALGLSAQCERRGDELWLRPTFILPTLVRSEITLKPDQRTLTPEEREGACKLLAEGRTLRQVTAGWPNTSACRGWRSGAH